MPRRSGFTLLEIMISVMIVAMIMLVAVPSITGYMREQTLKQTFDRLDSLVREAQKRAVETRRTHILRWEKGRIVLALEDVRSDDPDVIDSLEVNDGERFDITFTAALDKDPAPEWTFWPSGTCEPALVEYDGPKAKWTARFEPLTGRGVIEESSSK